MMDAIALPISPRVRSFLRARRNAGSSGVTEAVNVLQAAVTQLAFTFVETGVWTGKISRAGEPPAETVWVLAYGAEGVGRRQEQVKADASGNYRLELPPGDYRVHITASSAF